MTKIIQRHDTAANWTSVNPVLAAGEIGVETDTNKFKFGDGTTAWSSLAYAAGEGGGGSGTTLTSTDGSTTYSKLALGDTLSVTDTSTKELNKLTQTGGTLNSELEFTGASGASLKMTEKYSLSTADSWEFQIKYKHNGGGSSPTIFGYASGSDYKTPAFIYESGSLVLYMSSDGGSWNINQSGSGLVPAVGTIYYFKIGFTGSQYYIKYNTAGWDADFTTQWTLNSTTKVFCSDYFMLMNLSLNSGYYNTGTMYLQDTALIINGSEVWRGSKIIPGDIVLDVNEQIANIVNTKQDKLTAIEPITIRNQNITIMQFEQHGGNLSSSYVYNKVTTQSDYVQFKRELPLSTADTWEIGIKFNVLANSWGVTYNIISTDSNNSIYFTARNNTANYTYQFDFGFSFNGSQFNTVGFSNIGSHEILYVKLIFDGNNYICGYNTSGWDSSFNNSTYPSTNKIVNNPLLNILKDNIVDGYIGEIYLGESYYITNGVKTPFVETIDGALTIESNKATTSSLGVVQPDGTSITVSDTGVISGQDVKTFTGYSDTGTLVLKSINGVLQWVAE